MNKVKRGQIPTIIVAPITSTKPNMHFPTHVRLDVEGLISGSVVLLEQIRTIDKRRLDDYVGKFDKDMMGRSITPSSQALVSKSWRGC